ncbi:MAG: hypothetical protein ACREAN_03055, partial [Nitrosopumilaceae archaeon]
MSQALKLPQVLDKEQYLKLPTQEKERYARETIKETVNSNPDGVTVPQLAKALPFDARTIAKHLEVLTHTNDVYTVPIGATILYLPNGRLMHAVPLDPLIIKDRVYQAHVLQNRLGQFVFIQEKRKTDYSEEASGGLMISLASFDTFVKYLQA